jgi:hypothetical protein
MRRDLLHIDGHEWRYGDQSNGARRRFDDPGWKRGDNKRKDWHKLIGLDDVIQNNRRNVILVIEGSKDSLAAAEIANRSGILPQTGIICALGSGYRPIRSELEQLRDCWVGVIGDNDAAGIETTGIVSAALTDVGVDHCVWNWGNCATNAKDLFAFLDTSQKRNFASVLRDFFVPLNPSYNSHVQTFNRSTNKTDINKDELLGIVTPHVVTAKGTGNAMAFRLARAIKHRKFTTMQIEEIFQLWFEKSKSLLPPDDDESKSLETFHRQIKRVRFTEPALHAAIERARTTKPPFIAARDGDDEIELLAALCRELQRDAGDKPFICPVSVAQQFLGLRFATAANRLLHELEDEKVIECVDRGTPNKKGEKGRPTMWRYKLPLDQ